MRSARPSRRAACCCDTRGCDARNARLAELAAKPARMASPRRLTAEVTMPQIEEAQFVYWGSMRPDIIPLAAPGITMAVGPNGSGKSCWLDGLKIILGVSD